MNFEVQKVERLVTYFKDGRKNAYSFDPFGADLIAMNKDQIVFVQVKSNKNAISEAKKNFDKYPFPDFVGRWIIVCGDRDNPEIVTCG